MTTGGEGDCVDSAIALIPARAGSTRIADKNIRRLGAHPLIAYSIAAARSSGVFRDVLVSTDSPAYADIARHYGASVPFLRPAEVAGELSPDFEWVAFTLGRLRDDGREFDCFSILRPTSPFRDAGTIVRAWGLFASDSEADSTRAVEPCRQHPAKMWIVDGDRMSPLLAGSAAGQPWHSSPYQALPRIHVQNASLEIARTRVVFEEGTISGTRVMPFMTEGHEGFDINTPEDWELAETLVEDGRASLPTVTEAAWMP